MVAFWSSSIYVDGEDQDIEMPSIAVGDIVEAILDAEEGQISFVINDKSVGPFKHDSLRANKGCELFPKICMSGGTSLQTIEKNMEDGATVDPSAMWQKVA